jgi:ferritin-like metal-binding protein YciE
MRAAYPTEERTMPSDIHEQLTKYLTDAHSIEEQALAQLRDAPDHAGDPELAAAFREHLAETEGHEQRIRELLEARDAKPSRVKDAVMSVGGKGFLLFARLNPDTPGKLAAHALSYEGLELASYELLSRVAERAGEEDVAEVARSIRDEERAMMERLESGFDRSVEASLRELQPDDLKKQLQKYLADAHAIEEQAIALLERAPDIAGSQELAALYADHLAETRDHAEAVSDRLDVLGGDTSTLKDAALRLGALNWAAFFQGHPDTGGKLAAFAYAFEHLEIGGYEQLKRVARRAGDQKTVELAERILGEERTAAERIAAHFDEAATVALEQQGVAR